MDDAVGSAEAAVRPGNDGRPSGVRMAELVASLSLAVDLGLGLPQEHVLRQTLIARRLAAAAGLTEREQAAVYYTSLLAWVGCVSDSHELARWFGDDLRFRADSYKVDMAGLPMMRFVLGHVAGASPLRRLTAIGRLLATGFADMAGSFTAHCQTTGNVAEQLGLGVAALAADAARRLGLPAGEVTLVEHAGLVHDIGAIGVSTGVWDKPGRLSRAEWERVRTHPYLTERVLCRQPRLAQIGAVAGLHHERMDGSGYPRGIVGDAIPMAARLVAAADAYHALGEDRPHRPALPAAERAAALREEVAAGRMDGEAVNAVLRAAGHRVRRRPALPAGLTPREVEVLVLVVRGMSNRDIARQLSVSPRTVSSHLEHVYAKIGVTTRGAASMFAMRHGLVRAAAGVD